MIYVPVFTTKRHKLKQIKEKDLYFTVTEFVLAMI